MSAQTTLQIYTDGVCECILESSAEQEVAAGKKTLFCPLVWDGLQCWPKTAAGQLAVRPCPHYIDGFIVDGVLFIIFPLFS